VGAAAIYGVAAFAPALDGGPAPGDAAWSVVPFCAAFALAFVPWGRWADRRGPGAAMRAAAGLLLGAGFLLLVPLGDVGWAGARALEGAAAAGFPPAAAAALAALGGSRGAGRAIGGMSIAVALGTLFVPLVCGLAETATGTISVVAAGALGLPLVALAAVWPLARLTADGVSVAAATGEDPGAVASVTVATREGSGAATSVTVATREGSGEATSGEHGFALTSRLLAAWACALLVLLAYWTLVTRAAPLLGPAGAGLEEDLARAVPLAGGIAGIALTGVIAAIADRRGPRTPMIGVLLAGTSGLLLAAGVATATAAAVGITVFVAAYWCYLTLVGLQVVLSVPAAAHGRALGGLYSSMWTGAAVGGALVTLIDSWTVVIAVCALAWFLAAAIAARWFLGAPAAGQAARRRRAVPPLAAGPSRVDAATSAP